MLKEKLPEWYEEGYVPKSKSPTWDELKVGDTTEIQPFLLTEERIRKFAYGTQDEHPFYVDEEAAKNSKYGGLIAPPTIVVAIMFASVPPESHVKTPGAINPKQKYDDPGFYGQGCNRLGLRLWRISKTHRMQVCRTGSSW